MKRFLSSLINFKSEPYPLECPKCKVFMTWNPWQGPGTGGWKCPKCGLQLDHKG